MSEYKLSYTASEIDRKLGEIDNISSSIPSSLSELSDDSTHRTVTDVEKNTWSNKSKIAIQNESPIDGELWIDTDENEEITLAEIDDTTYSSEKTWSSSKINEKFENLDLPVEVAIQSDKPTDESIWINTDANEDVLIAEIDDDTIADDKTWSSKKLDAEVSELNKTIVMQKSYATPQMYEGTDTEKIQQAINENGFVLIPSGDYTIDSTITIPSSRKIQIEGKIWVNCEVGFMIQGNDIEFCGHGVVNIQSSLTNCSAFRFLLNQDLRFITLKDLTIWGAWNHNNDKNHIGIEFVGDSTVGTCCYVNINCNINCTTKGIWSHEATGQNADSWLTQVDVNSTFQNCLQAIAYEWGGGASRIRGVIQPKCTSAVTPNSVDLPLCILPEQTYMDAMVWDMHAAMNKYAIKVTGQNVTIFTALSKSYMDIASVVKPSLTLRIPTENILTKDDIDTSDPTLDIEFRIDNDGNLIMEKEAPYKNLFSGVSYQNGYRINSSGDLVAQSGAVTTDFIPYSDVSDSDLLMVKGASFGTAFGCLVVFYDENHTLLQGVRIMPDHFVSAYIIGSATVAFTGDSTKHPTIDENGITTIKINYDESQVVKTPIAYIRLVLEGTGSNLIVTRNEEIVDYDAEGKNIGKVKPKYGVDYFTTDEQEEFANAIIAKQKTETWTFTLADGSTVTKKVVLA